MFDGDPSALKPTPNQMRSGTSFEAVPPKEHRGVKVGPRRFRQRVASVLVKADRGRLSEMFLRRGIVAYAEIDSGGGC